MATEILTAIVIIIVNTNNNGNDNKNYINSYNAILEALQKALVPVEASTDIYRREVVVTRV